MAKPIYICFFLTWMLQPIDSMITYPEYFLAKYCNGDESVVFMGITPYYSESRKKLSADASAVALVKSATEDLKCNVVTNCSVIFVAPANHHLMITPVEVNTNHNIGYLGIAIDNKLEWLWDNNHEFNRTRGSVAPKSSRKGGNVKISVEVEKVSTTWEHFTFDIMITAFMAMSSDEDQICNEPFYFNCGNLRCLREALTCDDNDNCGNGMDEMDCGLDVLSASLLGAAAAISIIFIAVVLYLDHRPKLVIRLINEQLVDSPMI